MLTYRRGTTDCTLLSRCSQVDGLPLRVLPRDRTMGQDDPALWHGELTTFLISEHTRLKVTSRYVALENEVEASNAFHGRPSACVPAFVLCVHGRPRLAEEVGWCVVADVFRQAQLSCMVAYI